MVALIAIASVTFAVSLGAQTFDDPDSESEGGLEAEVDSTAEAPLPDQQLDDLLEENLPQQIEEQVSDGGEFDSFIPSEDISEDFSVPFPVDI